MAIRAGDATQIAQAGWGVIFHEHSDPAVRNVLRPLLEHRRAQAGAYYQEFLGERGYRAGDRRETFLARHGAPPNGRGEPSRVPYYLLLVGHPELIPYTFQQQLDIQYAVGRIFFENLEDYGLYAQTVVEAEMLAAQDKTALPRSMAIFGPLHKNDPATKTVSDSLLLPLSVWAEERHGWDVKRFTGEAATKRNLADLVGGKGAPSLLLIASHSLRFQSGDPRQEAYQGAIVCQDWPGPHEPVAPEHFFSAEDIQDEARLLGTMVVLLSSFSAGTPATTVLPSQTSGQSTEQRAAPRPFTARLAQRLLAHPRGGTLAVLGRTGELWLRPLAAGRETEAYEEFLSDILQGKPIGRATETFGLRYADSAVTLSDLLQESQDWGIEHNAEYIARLWESTEGSRNLVLLGDPAVRLHPSSQGSSVTRERPILEHLSEEANEPSIGSLSGATNDRVEIEDSLSYNHYIAVLSELIHSPHTKPPLTIGIFGSWGTGKSFILEHLARRIEAQQKARSATEPSITVVRFNAWEYNSTESIWPALVQKIIDSLKGQTPRRILWRLKRTSKAPRFIVSALTATAAALCGFALWRFQHVAPVLWGAFIAIGAGSLLKAVWDSTNNPLSKWVLKTMERGYGKTVSLMDDIRHDIEFLQEHSYRSHSRFLLLIDDLDRCHPSKAVETLEAIKLMLDFDSFIICMALDARIITRAIESYYEDILGPSGISGYEYLDKIVQIPFRIPEPLSSDVQEFIVRQLGNPRPPKLRDSPQLDATSVEDLRMWLDETLRARGGWSASELGPGLSLTVEQHKARIPAPPARREQAAFTNTELRAFRAYSRFLKANPRHLKRLVNIYRLVRALALQKREELILRRPEATIRWLIMCFQWPYTAHLMLGRLEASEKSFSSEENPLLTLLDAVQEHLDKGMQRRLDFEPQLLRELLSLETGNLSSEELRIFRGYTINFNPAIDIELGEGYRGMRG